MPQSHTELPVDEENLRNEEEAVDYILHSRQEDLDADAENRERGLEDGAFVGGFQWLESDKTFREQKELPIITINRAPAFLFQSLAMRQRARVGPRVISQSIGEQFDQIAQVREGLMRQIEAQSRADRVYQWAALCAYAFGIGNFEIALEFANADVFEQDIFVRRINHPFSVIWDRASMDETGLDAAHVAKDFWVTEEEFKRKWPKAKAGSVLEDVEDATFFTGVGRSATRFRMSEWRVEGMYRISSFWRMRERPRTIAMLEDGSIVDVTDVPDPVRRGVQLPDGTVGQIMRNPHRNGEPMMRESPVRYAEQLVTNGMELLEEPYEVPIDRVPIIRAPGFMLPDNDGVQRYSMFSFAKDPMRFHNYIRSERVARFVRAPKANWYANDEQVEGYEAMWENSHKDFRGLLKHRGPAGSGPQRVEPPVVDNAAIIESQASVQDIIDVLNKQAPGFGDIASTTPNSAIVSREQITQSGDIVFNENLNSAIREGYRIMNQLFEYAYDTPRIAKIIGRDDKPIEAILNDPDNPASIDIGQGKYDIDIDIGPSAQTRREHALNFLQTMVNAMPDSMAIVGDKLFELSGVDGADQLARRWRERFGVTDDDDPEQQAARQQAQQQQAELQRLQLEMSLQSAQLDLAKKQAEVAQAEASAAEKQAEAQREIATASSRVAETEAKVLELAERVRLLEAQRLKIEADTARVESEAVKAGVETRMSIMDRFFGRGSNR